MIRADHPSLGAKNVPILKLVVIEETDKIMKLQYRTRRRGFHFYVQGQVLGLVKTLTILFGLETVNAIYSSDQRVVQTPLHESWWHDG